MPPSQEWKSKGPPESQPSGRRADALSAGLKAAPSGSPHSLERAPSEDPNDLLGELMQLYADPRLDRLTYRAAAEIARLEAALYLIATAKPQRITDEFVQGPAVLWAWAQRTAKAALTPRGLTGFALVPKLASDEMVDAADWISRADGRACWRKMVRAAAPKALADLDMEETR